MKNIYLLSMLGSLILAMNLNAAPISEDDAKNVAKNWMLEKSGQELEIDESALGATSNQSDAYRIIKLKPTGWVIVSADDVAKPIIGYGFSEVSNEKNLAFDSWMKGIEDQINSAKNNLGAMSNEEQKEADEIQKTWAKYKITTTEFKNNTTLSATGVDDFDYVVRPLLWLGSDNNIEDQGIEWNQNPYENQACPVDKDGSNGHAYVGCVATTMGQIMRYYQYPERGIGSHSYTPSTHPEYGEQSVDFGETLYDWATMPLKLTEDNSAVAQALYHAGVAVDMNYGNTFDGGSGAYFSRNDGMRQFFGYEIASIIYRENYSDIKWQEVLHNELDNSRPIAYAGFSDTGHQFIIDGYDADNFYHLNWGWGGYYNGKFELDDLTPDDRDYSHNQSAVIILPHDTSPTVLIADENLRTCVMDALDVESASDITEIKVKFLTSLSCYSKKISDLSGLENFVALSTLYFGYNEVTDLSVLKNLTSLSKLDFRGNNVTDISVLENLTALEYLYFDTNKISNIEPLDKLTNLKYVSLYNNYITDFTSLDDMAGDIKGKDSQYALLAPSNLTFTDKTQTSVTLHWLDNSDNETGYKIYRDGVLIKTIAKDSTSYTDNNLQQATTYGYTIKATLE